MGIRISTRERLNSNFYNSMVIREVDNGYFVKVTGYKSSNKYILTSIKFSDNLKGLNQDDKVICIVENFLENATISGIEVGTRFHGYSGTFIKISGSRCLYLQLLNNDILTTIIEMVIEKYNRDRYKYIFENSTNMYSISLKEKESSYETRFILCEDCKDNENDDFCEVCPKIINFNLMYSNMKIVNFDNKFIERFVFDKLWEVGCPAIIIENTREVKLANNVIVGSYVSSYCINCGNLSIEFNCTTFSKDYVFNFCNDIVTRYNKESSERDNKVKKKQLKMEGF